MLKVKAATFNRIFFVLIKCLKKFEFRYLVSFMFNSKVYVSSIISLCQKNAEIILTSFFTVKCNFMWHHYNQISKSSYITRFEKNMQKLLQKFVKKLDDQIKKLDLAPLCMHLIFQCHDKLTEKVKISIHQYLMLL